MIIINFMQKRTIRRWNFNKIIQIKYWKQLQKSIFCKSSSKSILYLIYILVVWLNFLYSSHKALFNLIAFIVWLLYRTRVVKLNGIFFCEELKIFAGFAQIWYPYFIRKANRSKKILAKEWFFWKLLQWTEYTHIDNSERNGSTETFGWQ